MYEHQIDNDYDDLFISHYSNFYFSILRLSILIHSIIYLLVKVYVLIYIAESNKISSSLSNECMISILY